jgi:hypothetical protein
MTIEILDEFPANENPFLYDLYHMGTYLGKNVLAMYEKHTSEHQRYIILEDITTGQRVRISFAEKVTA